MVDTPTTLKRVRKILALAAGAGSPEEAAVAAAHAHRLLRDHKLTLADLDQLEIEPFVEITRPYIKESWRQVLAGVLAKHNYCQLLIAPEVLVRYVGHKTDIDTVLAIYEYLSRVIARQARAGYQQRIVDLTDPTLGRHPALDEPDDERRWVDSFKVGAVETVALRLSREELIERSTALIRVTTQLDDWVKAKYTHVRQTEVDVEISPDGFAKGVKAGTKLSLRRPT